MGTNRPEGLRNNPASYSLNSKELTFQSYLVRIKQLSYNSSCLASALKYIPADQPDFDGLVQQIQANQRDIKQIADLFIDFYGPGEG